MKCPHYSWFYGSSKFKKKKKKKLTLSPLWRVALAMLDLSWFEVFCITSNHLQEYTIIKKIRTLSFY